MRIWVDIENASGTKYGDGPIEPISWEYADALDRAGKFKFLMATADPKATLIVSKRRARCWGILNGVLTDMGAGIIDNIDTKAGADGKIVLTVGGDNLMRELVDRQVGNLVIDDGAGNPDTSGPSDIMAFAPAGWSLDVVNGYSTTAKAIYHTFEGESVLAALVRLAELTGEHFRLGAGRKIIWMRNDRPASSIRAVQYIDPLSDAPENCIITDAEEVRDSFGLMTRVYAYGIGEGDQRISLLGLTGWSKTGYSLNNVDNYIKRDSAESTYGQIERYMSFKDINDQTTLAEVVYEYLKRNSDPYYSYKVNLANLRQRVAPGSTLSVDYQRWIDGYHAVNISGNILVLESTFAVDANGVSTVSMQIANLDRWPVSDATAVVASNKNSQNYYTHDQGITSHVAPHASTHFAGGSDAISPDDIADDSSSLVLLKIGNAVAIGYNASTGERGLLTKGVNRTGHTSVKGELVSVSTTADSEYILQANEYDTIGIVAEAGVAQGSEMWIWKPGSRAQVLYKDGVGSTRGNILIAADTDGRAIDISNPGIGLPGTDTHFKECGHVLKTLAAGTNVLVLCEIHTN